MVTVHNFSYGLLNPALAYVVSCLGSFLGLRCITRARALEGTRRAAWISIAAVALGATGIWAMHFIAMLGFTIPGQTISYNVPLTIASMLIAIVVVGAGLFIIAYGNGGWGRLLAAGLIVGIGVASMHYLGMEAMSMPDTMSYNPLVFIASIVIAIVAGTTALWISTWVSSWQATLGAALVMGVAVSGMHYTGMAAMHVYASIGGAMSMSGATGSSFLFPLIAGISFLSLILTLIISLSPTEEEIALDARIQQQLLELERKAQDHARASRDDRVARHARDEAGGSERWFR